MVSERSIEGKKSSWKQRFEKEVSFLFFFCLFQYSYNSVCESLDWTGSDRVDYYLMPIRKDATDWPTCNRLSSVVGGSPMYRSKKARHSDSDSTAPTNWLSTTTEKMPSLDLSSQSASRPNTSTTVDFCFIYVCVARDSLLSRASTNIYVYLKNETKKKNQGDYACFRVTIDDVIHPSFLPLKVDHRSLLQLNRVLHYIHQLLDVQFAFIVTVFWQIVHNPGA